MRIFIIDTYYPDFLNYFYAQHTEIAHCTYSNHWQNLMNQCFGIDNFYSINLRKLGHEVHGAIVNCDVLQKAWMREYGIGIEKEISARRCIRLASQTARAMVNKMPLSRFKRFLQPMAGSLFGHPSWFYDILAAQVRYYKPDVFLNLDMHSISSNWLRGIKPDVKLLVGQHAATTLPDSKDWRCYDLVVSSFPPTIEWFQQKGIPAKLLRLGFEPSVLSRLQSGCAAFDVTFVGSLYSVHSSRIAFLETLCDRLDQKIKVWGPGVEHLSTYSPIRQCYCGHAWGLEMYQILCKSKVTINHHGDIAPYANNCRLYEATGVGSLLITDWKENLHEMFALGKEVIAYRNVDECIEFIQYYLEHEEERIAIAGAGRQRTLREHTYYQRMQEFVEILSEFV